MNWRELNLPWVIDPNTKLPSVSLTLLVLSFVGVLTAAGLELAEVTKSTSVATELFYANVALYFGRRFTVNNKKFASDESGSEESTNEESK